MNNLIIEKIKRLSQINEAVDNIFEFPTKYNHKNKIGLMEVAESVAYYLGQPYNHQLCYDLRIILKAKGCKRKTVRGKIYWRRLIFRQQQYK